MRLIILLLLLLGTFFHVDNSQQKNKVIELNRNNFVTVRGPITSSSVSEFLMELFKLEGDELYIYITSPGGSIVSGYEIIQAINTLNETGKKVICIADIAASMGFAILQACPIRYIRPISIIMQHQMQVEFEGSIEQVKSRLKLTDALEKELIKMQAKKLKMTEDEFINKINNDWWLFGKEILNNNAGDEMVHVICEKSLMNEIQVTNISTIFGTISFEFSKCPLIRQPIKVNIDLDELKFKIIKKFFTLKNE